MKTFEEIMLAALLSAPSITPIFVKSPQGILIANASETLLANILAQLSAQKPTASAQ